MVMGPMSSSGDYFRKGLQLVADEIQQQNVENPFRGKVS